MKIGSLLTNVYRTNAQNNSKNTVQNFANALEVNNGHMSLKRQLRDAGNSNKNQNALGDYNKYLKSSMSYGDSLRAQREKMKTASLEKKKLKYAYKDISSQIVRSKTSMSARKAAGQAKRELMRLQKEKASGKYDPEEIEAAIAHAKSMERVAKKKVKHLEQEEMARAAAGLCVDLEEREDSDREEFNVEDLKATDEEYDAYSEDEISESTESMDESIEVMEADMQDMLDEMSESIVEMSESLQDMLDEMGFGDMTESVKSMSGDMDPQDLKMMKIKHRCKEMKEIAKADSEYLKAVFEQLAKEKDAGAGAIFGSSGGNAGVTVTTDIAPIGAVVAGPETAAPVIDISL